MYEESCKIFIVDICSYGMLSAIDGKSKAMYLVYGDEVFCWSGPPEYMSATALTRLIHWDSYKNKLMDKIQKNMMVPDKPKDTGKETLSDGVFYSYFRRFTEHRSLLVVYVLTSYQTLRVVPHGTKGTGPRFVTRPVYLRP